MLREDSHRTGTADSPVCECGFDTESAEQFLLHCSRFQESQNKLQDTLGLGRFGFFKFRSIRFGFQSRVPGFGFFPVSVFAHHRKVRNEGAHSG